MRRLSAGVGVCLAALTAGCFPPDLDPSGKGCLDNRCAPGFVCALFDHRCYKQGSPLPDAGVTPSDGGGERPRNLLQNGDFELLVPAQLPQRPDFWKTPQAAADFAVERKLPHSGLAAVRISTTGNAQFGLVPNEPPVVDPTAGTLYCFQAWARGEPDGGSPQARLSIRELDEALVVKTTATGNPLPMDGTWKKLAVGTPATGLWKYLDVRLFSNSAQPGDTLTFDEADLWRSVDGGCNDRPY